MLRALTANLVAHERIETTEAKAKELRRVAERLITRAVRLGPIAYTAHDKLSIADRARRQAAQQRVGAFLRRFVVIQKDGQDQRIDLLEKVFVDLTQRFRGRPGGYTRIVKLGRRRGDAAPMSLIELVEGAATNPRETSEKTKEKAEPKQVPPAAGKTPKATKPRAKRASKTQKGTEE